MPASMSVRGMGGQREIGADWDLLWLGKSELIVRECTTGGARLCVASIFLAVSGSIVWSSAVVQPLTTANAARPHYTAVSATQYEYCIRVAYSWREADDGTIRAVLGDVGAAGRLGIRALAHGTDLLRRRLAVATHEHPSAGLGQIRDGRALAPLQNIVNEH
jgi:hypothetical protein